MNKKGLLVFLSILYLSGLQAQNCNLSLSGYILDKGTGIPLAFSNIMLEDQDRGVVSDSSGFFQFKNLCPDEYHILVSHIGCEPQTTFITIGQDTSVSVLLNHHVEFLDEVVVHGEKDENSAQISSTLSKEEIEQNSHKNLSDVLEQIAGVSVLKNGAGISKPVIHGLYGNRVAILNNGIEQSGQQWGNDHAPEIDPFFASHLSVVKGAGALAYGSNSLGSVVLVESDKISKDPHLHGLVNYTFNSNGLGNTLNTQFERNTPWAAWRLSSTLKLQGDSKTPDYFLTNTGKREGNLALQVEKKMNDKWFTDVYLSTFNTEIGVLRGSHIGNLTDLETALERAEPFFTEDNFSYKINAPRQRVGHHLLKVESRYFLKEHQLLKFKYGGQLNDRKEFDVRRGGRTSRAALNLRQFAHSAELNYQHHFKNNFLLKSGLQYRFIYNDNQPGTGVLPLIPNYESHTTSAFLIGQKEQGKAFFELGGRFDQKLINVTAVSQSLPRVFEHFDHQFSNYSVSGGAKYDLTESLEATFNLGYMLRAPEVNELYSAGLHQGVSGIEEGTRTLNAEKSLKGILSLDWFFQKKLFFQALAYYQNIEDYIYLQPQDKFRLTIRGAFPVFKYEQTNAQILGSDFLLTYEPTPSTKWLFKYSYIKGRDLSNDLGLINIPANNLFSSINFSLEDKKHFKKNTFSINGKYVFQQTEVIPEQDFSGTPDAYFLLGLKANTILPFGHSKLHVGLSVENLLNTTYRDYLNRLRYFADEPGINVVFNLKYSF